MKPISLTTRNRRSFPLVGHYFQKEARRDFVGEAFLFAVMVILAAAPVLSTASALSEFCRAIAPL